MKLFSIAAQLPKKIGSNSNEKKSKVEGSLAKRRNLIKIFFWKQFELQLNKSWCSKRYGSLQSKWSQQQNRYLNYFFKKNWRKNNKGSGKRFVDKVKRRLQRPLSTVMVASFITKSDLLAKIPFLWPLWM